MATVKSNPSFILTQYLYPKVFLALSILCQREVQVKTTLNRVKLGSFPVSQAISSVKLAITIATDLGITICFFFTRFPGKATSSLSKIPLAKVQNGQGSSLVMKKISPRACLQQGCGHRLHSWHKSSPSVWYYFQFEFLNVPCHMWCRHSGSFGDRQVWKTSFNIGGQIYSEPYPNIPEGRNMVVSSPPFPLAAIKARTETAVLEFFPNVQV